MSEGREIEEEVGRKTCEWKNESNTKYLLKVGER